MKKNPVIIPACPFTPLKKVEKDALVVAAKRYGQFVGMAVEIIVQSVQKV